MGFFRISSPRTSNKFACNLPNRLRVSYEKSRKIGLSQGKWFWTSLRWLRWKIRRKKRGIDVPNPWSTSKTINWRKQKLKCGDNITLMKRGGTFCIQINIKSLPLLFFSSVGSFLELVFEKMDSSFQPIWSQRHQIDYNTI